MDVNDLEALTPNHLLLLKTQPSLPPGLFVKDEKVDRGVSTGTTRTPEVAGEETQFSNKKGLIRQVKIKTKSTYLTRPITKICLELLVV
ncbi:uncharacterized protein LOC119199441 [Tachysurus ichikawai]